VLALKRDGWRHGAKGSSYGAWERSFAEAKALHQMPIDAITSDDIEKIVATKWDKGHHVEARLMLNRISDVFNYAKAKRLRSGDNPAGWSTFKFLAPAKPKTEAQHHPMLEWKQAPSFMASLRAETSMAAVCLEYLVLTGTRLSEATKAEWSEIDLDARTWVIPASRMKRGAEHTVPLSDRAVAILKALRENRASDGRSRFVFPGIRKGKPLSGSSVKVLCARLTGGEASPHGWRATLRSFMADHEMPFDLAESMLAHSRGAIVNAYHRSQMVELRRPWMEAWATFLLTGKAPTKVGAKKQAPTATNVVPLREVA
jgi:integrase